MGITSINRLAEDNIGGGKNYLLLADWKGIDVFPDIINKNIADDITLLPGYNWVRWELTEQSLKYLDTPVENDGVRGYNQEIQLVLPKDRLELRQVVFASTFTRAVVLYVSANSDTRVIGSKLNPAIIQRPVISHGNNPTDLNSLSVVITNTHRYEAPVYKASIPESGSSLGAVTITNAETGDTIATVLAPGTYPVLVFSGIIDTGAPYTDSIIDPGP